MGFFDKLFGYSSHKETAKNTDNNILFYVDDPHPEELELCSEGQYVNFWARPDKSEMIYIFRKGSIGGTGKIGLVPKKYSRLISISLLNGLDYDTEIISIENNSSSCQIKCKLYSKEETKLRRDNQSAIITNSIKAELSKKYAPRKSLFIRIQLPLNHNLKVGQELYLQELPMEYYIQNACGLCINFVDSNGTIIAHKNNEPHLIINLLRAYYSKCSMNINVSFIDSPDKFILKYINQIEGKAEVSFKELGTIGITQP